MNVIAKIIRKKGMMTVAALGITYTLILGLPTLSHASTVVGFNPGHIIDDGVMTDSGSMSVIQIQNFLNAKVPSCDTNGTLTSEFGGGTRAQWAATRGYYPPFTCLKDYAENGLTSAQIIKNASQQYQINPQVLIVLLQKEQGLVTDTWPTSNQYRSAAGYGCPDSTPGVCNSSYYGFTNQIANAAKLFHSVITSSPSWYSPYVLGNNYIQWSPNSSCGGSTVNIQNLATVSLYDYTPYQPNQSSLNAGYGSGDSCSSYGNRNFYHYFTDWFGNTLIKVLTASEQNSITNNNHYGTSYCSFLKPSDVPVNSYCKSPMTGDFNGDGYQDIAVLSIFPDGKSFNLWLFPGGPSGIGDPVLQRHFDAADGWDISMNKFVAIDVNRDGITDLVSFARGIYDGITMVEIDGNGDGLKQQPKITVNDAIYKAQPTGWYWECIDVIRQTGDFNNDGYDDIAVLSIFPDKKTFNLWVFPGSATGLGNPILQRTFDVNQFWDASNNKFVALDINKDKTSDLFSFARSAYNGITFVEIDGGSTGLKQQPEIIVNDNIYKSQPTGWYWDNIR